jgi:hypothetical protein
MYSSTKILSCDSTSIAKLQKASNKISIQIYIKWWKRFSIQLNLQQIMNSHTQRFIAALWTLNISYFVVFMQHAI